MTAAERELVEAALVFANTSDSPSAIEARWSQRDIAGLAKAAAKVREERKAKPRYATDYRNLGGRVNIRDVVNDKTIAVANDPAEAELIVVALNKLVE